MRLPCGSDDDISLALPYTASGAFAVTNALVLALDKTLGKPRVTADNPEGYASAMRAQHQKILAKLERHQEEFVIIMNEATAGETSVESRRFAP